MFGDKLKKIAKKKSNEKTDDKKIENLVFFIVIVIITIIVINFILKVDKKTATENTTKNKQLAGTSVNDNAQKDSGIIEDNSSQNLDLKLEEILKQIDGVGDVKVFVNYSETSETVAMYNENSKVSNTQEEDTSGGVRKIEETDTQKEIIYQENNGEKVPITQKIISPKIEGAIITAKGAGDANVKANIIQAVEAATGLATHKIQVFTMS